MAKWVLVERAYVCSSADTHTDTSSEQERHILLIWQRAVEFSWKQKHSIEAQALFHIPLHFLLCITSHLHTVYAAFRRK